MDSPPSRQSRSVCTGTRVPANPGESALRGAGRAKSGSDPDFPRKGLTEMAPP